MTTVHFPRSYTQEEEMLLKKYSKLRKKRKALQALKAPKQDPAVKEPPPVARSASETAEIKEDIKKLVKAGAIKLDSDREKKAFKRKLKEIDRPERTTSSGFHPIDPEVEKLEPSSSKKLKGLYDSFVPGDTTSGSDVTTDESEKTPDRRQSSDDRRPPRRDFPKRGNTICISAHGINEKFVRDNFVKFGEIVNLKVEAERKRCFLSFSNNDAADSAIKAMDCTLVSGIYLKVMLARRQPNFNIQIPPETGPPKTVWGGIATHRSQKGESGNRQDGRDMVTYDAEDLF